MKAYVLFFLLSGDPVMLKDYDTLIDCNAALASAKLSLSTADAVLHRCASQADFKFGVELARQRAFEAFNRGDE